MARMDADWGFNYFQQAADHVETVAETRLYDRSQARSFFEEIDGRFGEMMGGWDTALDWLVAFGGIELVPRLQSSCDAILNKLWQLQREYTAPPADDCQFKVMVSTWESLSQQFFWFSAQLRKASRVEKSHELTEVQEEILSALDGRRMLVVELEAKLEVCREKLYGKRGKGGLKELKEWGLVKQDSQKRGYFRPDRKPARKANE